jgi:hypothetical protein
VGIRRLSAVLVLVVIASVACTDETQSPTGPSTPPSSAAAPPTKDSGDVDFQLGEFEYSWEGVDIRFSLDGSTGTLDVDNGSGARLGAPGLYAILGDGTRSDATIGDPGGIADGERASFDVTFPASVDETTIGLIVLLFGGNNWGALAPVPTGG